MLTCLDPIVDDRIVVLILGSMPSQMSLDAGQYYANPRNYFWRVIHQIFDEVPHPSYERRISFLREKGIGLWDVLRECSRDGSLDSNIRNAVPNDLDVMLASHPTIRHVFFNGSKAMKVFGSSIHIDPRRRACITFELLPSTSPANTSLGYEMKLERWRAVRRCLSPDPGK
jgi:TDG/mug DNA glycosylase family protein